MTKAELLDKLNTRDMDLYLGIKELEDRHYQMTTGGVVYNYGMIDTVKNKLYTLRTVRAEVRSMLNMVKELA